LAAGVAEILLGTLLLLVWRSRALLVLVIALMTVAVAFVAYSSPRFIGAAFTPVTLNGCVMALAIIALLTSRDLPTAARCRRKPQKER
jgi:hypothetical protein